MASVIGDALLSFETKAAAMLPNLDRIIRGVLYVFIFSLPFHLFLNLVRYSFIILIVLLVLWCGLHRRHFFLWTPIDLPLLLFIAWVGLTVPFAIFPAYSFKEYAKLLQHCLMFYAVVYFFRAEIHRRRLVWVLMVALAVIGMYGVWQYEAKPWKGFHPDFPESGSRAVYLIYSFTPSDVWLTTYLVMMIPLGGAMALYVPDRRLKWLAGITTVVAVLCEVLTFSRAGLVAILLEAFTFVWITRQKKVAIIAGALTLALVIGTAVIFLVAQANPESQRIVPDRGKLTFSGLEARMNVWGFALTKLQEHPVFGLGLGKDNFYIATGRESTQLLESEGTFIPGGTHNSFLDIAVGTGIPGVFLFLWLLAAIVRAGLVQFMTNESPIPKALSLALIAVVVGMSARNFFDHMWVGTMAVMFWVIVGLCVESGARLSVASRA